MVSINLPGCQEELFNQCQRAFRQFLIQYKSPKSKLNNVPAKPFSVAASEALQFLSPDRPDPRNRSCSQRPEQCFSGDPESSTRKVPVRRTIERTKGIPLMTSSGLLPMTLCPCCTRRCVPGFESTKPEQFLTSGRG